uniref:Ig-like domain-containing protein n=2 Tax=Haplochromini TaxID=319058 RepID=A0A3P9AV65_9CICH
MFIKLSSVTSLLCVSFSDHKNVTAESGHDVILTCRAPNNNNRVVQWSRADLESEYVLLYRDNLSIPEYQHPSFKNRVDLQDRQMKDGDVSVILRDVTVSDTGTYECHVFVRKTLSWTSISKLSVCVIRGEAASWLLMFVSKDILLFILLMKKQRRKWSEAKHHGTRERANTLN